MAQRAKSATPKRTRKVRGGKPRVVGPFSIIATKLIVLCAIAAGGALAYLVYNLATGAIGAFPQRFGSSTPLSATERATLVSWVTTATRLLAWGGLLACLLALARYYETSEPILAAGAAGAFFYAGMPALVGGLLQQHYTIGNLLTDTTIVSSQAAGKVLLVVAGARGAVQVFLRAVRRPRRMRRVAPVMAKRTARPPSLFRQCWDLDHCRSTTRSCPRAYQRKSCWKVRSGCHCDLTLAAKLSHGAEAWAHEEAVAIRARAGRSAPCKSCPLYEEHQTYKFRVLEWLAYPVTIGVMVALRHPLHWAYDVSLRFMERTVAMLKFMPDASAAGTGMQSMVLGSNVEWVFVGCLWLLLLSYALGAIEHVTFRWGW